MSQGRKLGAASLVFALIVSSSVTAMKSKRFMLTATFTVSGANNRILRLLSDMTVNTNIKKGGEALCHAAEL